MKTLYDLKQGDVGVIKKIHSSNRELKARFISFGFTKGSEVEIKNCNINRKNLEIQINDTLVALREEEAKTIEVEVLQ